MYESFKRLLDIIISTILLLLTFPLIVISMIMVWAGSTGSPLYRQRRLGHLGRIIAIYKIRTMYEGSERDSGAVWSLRGDPRITPIGRILRAIHIDELPQLINVLRGEMSLIGPRPERPEIVTWLEGTFPKYRDRLRIRPGLSGLAQVLQSPDTGLHSVGRKLSYDLFYIDNIGISLDLRIIAATILHILHLPARLIARLCCLPVNPASAGDESAETCERVTVSPQAHPFCVN
jgi:lipopolysaccharide/colanic/teichoic acid biosynthesis glycosyltransferase